MITCPCLDDLELWLSEQQPEQFDFEEELKRCLRAEPFAPFDIVVTSGDHYRITDPLAVAMGGNTVVTVLPRTGIRYFRKNQIVAVHVDDDAAT